MRDAGLIGAAQRVEHYEIAGYGTARALATQLGYDDAAELLGETLRRKRQPTRSSPNSRRASSTSAAAGEDDE